MSVEFNTLMLANKAQVRNANSVTRYSVEGWLLIIVLLVYGVFSSPFPATYGIPELIIGVLMTTICIAQLPALLRIIGKGSSLIYSVPFGWMLIVPTSIGLVTWNISDIIRDIVPLFYLFLPIVILPWLEKSYNSNFWRKYYVPAMVTAGCGFSLRYFTSQDIGYEELGSEVFLINLEYFSYDPAVTFTAIFGLLFALVLFKSSSKGKFLGIFLYSMASLLAVGSLGGIAQRAPLALLSFFLLIFLLKYAKAGLIYVLIAILFLLAISIYFQDIGVSFYTLLNEKNEAVGFNNKIEELELIIAILSDNWFSMLFGLGWGAVYYNDVLSGDVRFAHSVVGYYLIKTGLIGSITISLYAIWLFRRYAAVLIYAWRNNITQLPLLFAIGSAPIVAMLQPTYKTLSFGLILVYIPVLYLEMLDKLNKYKVD